MRFGDQPVAEALGSILAHSLQVVHRRIAKGSVLSEADLSDLLEAGHAQITTARLDPDDVHEDDAALRLAQALAPDAAALGLRISAAGAGRVNLYATGAGIVRLSSERLLAANLVDPMISVATVPDYHRVDANSMVATIKIISYAVADANLVRAAEGAAEALRVLPPVLASATLIETQVGALAPAEKGRLAIAGRLDRFGVALSERVCVPHASAPIAQALRKAPGTLVLILTGSATSDPSDVAPEALRQAGGTVTRFGMPVDPGNLLFLGALGTKPVIGLPGCARSPALNGADWVLERVICGQSPTSDDIARMGIGGLLKEIPTRPRPRAG